MKKKFAGYINLKLLNGVLYPSSMQNILMKDYVQQKLKSIFYLSPTEVLQAKYAITLQTLLGPETSVSGVVMLSSFLLPSNFVERFKIYSMALKNKKSIHFILDEIIFKSKKDINLVEDFYIFNDKFFTETKMKMNSFEELLLKNIQVSFV